VNYAFEQLAMHRVTLLVVTENARAVDLYKFM
jgi:RimJ/RimL family protein N-acetyltransferase